jgi:hypothetical protein
MCIEQGENVKASRIMGGTRSLKNSPNICLMTHGLGTFGLTISNLEHDLTFNPLLFHHVVHIKKKSFLELR